jgi:precorrin-4/cobalt-precorrin-4 C11-methyltransferase
MIFYLSVHLISNIVKAALAGGYSKSTPVGIVYRASWDAQKIITGTLETISKKIKEQKISRTAIIIIGDVVKPKSYEYSRLYDKPFSHMFRKGKTSSKN